MNGIRAVTNTYSASIVASSPKPRFLTDDGSWDLKKRAKGLQRWTEGKFDELKLYDAVSHPMCIDSAVFGTGLARVFRKHRQSDEHMDVGVKRVFPWEVLTDDAESQELPRMRALAQRSWYDRSELACMYPKHADYIMRHAPKQGPQFTAFDWAVDTAADLVRVYELWHLPSAIDADDGLYCVCVEGMVIHEEKYTRDRFPFVFLWRDKPTMGMWGVSIPHELRGMQTHINQSLLDIEECLQLYGKPKWIIAAGSVPKNILDDDIDSIVEFSGPVPPQTYTPSVMPAETYAFLWQTWQKMFDMIGVSQAGSEGETPEGLSGSGASIRAWNDVRSGRLFKPSKNFEEAHLEIADLMIDEARAIAEIRPDYASAWRGKRYVQVIKFLDVDPGEDKFWLTAWPESRLSKAPAQRLAQLQELLNSQTIGQEEFRELLDFPDLAAEDSLHNAGRNLARMLIDRFLDAEDPEKPGVFMYPDPTWPLPTIAQMMTMALTLATIDEAPEGNLRLLRQFLQMVSQMTAPPPAAPSQMPQAGAPPAQLPQGQPQAPGLPQAAA